MANYTGEDTQHSSSGRCKRKAQQAITSPCRDAGIGSTSNDRCWRGCGETGPRARLVATQAGAAAPENSVEGPQKLKI